jgi:uncharacterized protein YbjT (DUF2867 family)
MSEKQTILVTGATGAQGGGVARHLLDAGRFTVRILTRNPASGKADALRQSGAEIVAGDMEDAASMRSAMRGCWGVFGVTNFWEHFDKEYRQGKNLVDAVADSAVENFVFSTLPWAKKITGGKIEVPHFDIKAQLEGYARDRRMGAIFVHVAYYYENFLTFFPPRKQPDGTFTFGFPQGNTPLAAVAVPDVGGVVSAIFDRPDQHRDKVIGIVGDEMSGAEYAQVMSRVLGKPIIYNDIPREVFAGFGFPGAEDLANMFDFNRQYIPTRAGDVAQSRALYSRMQRFEPWLLANKDRFNPVLAG